MSQELTTEGLAAPLLIGTDASRPWRLRAARLARWALAGGRVLLFWGLLVGATYQGFRLRQWLYPTLAPLRFPGDIANAWAQGSAILRDAQRALPRGSPLTWRAVLGAYQDRYDRIAGRKPDGQYGLDYAPARLLVVTLWVWHTVESLPAPHRTFWVFPQKPPPPHELAGRLLDLNTCMGFMAAVGVFLIVRMVLHRRGPRLATDFIALASAALLWFNPAVLLDAHVWPQWDVWLLPFYLWAAWLGLRRQWLAAGACLAVGAMFKGQILCTAGLFLLWPLFQRRWADAGRVVLGFVLGLGLCAAPWMLRTPAAWVFLLAMVLIGSAATILSPAHLRITCAAAILGGSLLLAGACFGGSFNWWNIGFAYGARHFPIMNIGATGNLGAALGQRFGWGLRDLVWTIDWPAAHLYLPVTMRILMIALYGITLALCGFGLARADLRGERRCLIALAAPWVLMFALLPQMHERYLVWGAAVSALAAGASVGAILLHLVITLLACLPILFSMLMANGARTGWLLSICRGCYPDSAWALLLAAGALLYLTLVPDRRRDASV